ncbi:MAG: phage terminase large subunit [Thiothrix sp.]|uniref:phage terminase large subunit n=1 Tax=Thiothrix sp. TaxID=1032 RepID=UPI002633D05E|nr:phage terminase large subunit [Thiothrix sp.]MDD5394954.1 phage terminase large subunit [Thiothrix sp.]
MPISPKIISDEFLLKALKAQKEDCKNYRAFFANAWPILEPATPLVWNWHYDVLCDELQHQAERIAAKKPREYDIIVNIFRRSGKTTIDNKLLVPYVWSRFPEQRFVGASYDLPMALEHALDSRTVIQSRWYQMHWGRNWEMQIDQNVKSLYKNSAGGYRITTAVGGGGGGKGGDWIIIDDPIDPEKAAGRSKVKLLECISWYTRSIWQSVNNAYALRMIVMQRVHEDDLSGYLLKNYPGDYKLFCIPGEEGDNISPPELRKHYVNGLAFPARLNQEEIETRKGILGNDFHAQVNQRPTAPEGGMFKRYWWRFWRPAGSDLPDVMLEVDGKPYTCRTIDLPGTFDDEIDSWDMGLKGGDENDPCVGAHWTRTPNNFFLLDGNRGLYTALQKEEEVLALRGKHPNTSATIIEDATGGSDTIRYLQTKEPGIIGKNALGDKKTRAIPAARLAQSGNIYLPHPSICPWIKDYIEEMAVFDRGTHDEWVDTTSQAINYFFSTKRVFSQYGGETSNFEVGLKNLDRESQIIVSQWMDRNQQSSIIMSLWNPNKGKLHVFGEYFNELSVPETIRGSMGLIFRSIGKVDFKDIRSLKWFGSELMHSKAVGNIQMQYAAQKIRLERVMNYDEATAINRLGRLFVQKNIAVHRRCDNLKSQMLSWTYEKSGNTYRTAEGCGFCRALCLSVAAIWTSGQIKKKVEFIKPYSREAQAVYGENKQGGMPDKYGWMKF